MKLTSRLVSVLFATTVSACFLGGFTLGCGGSPVSLPSPVPQSSTQKGVVHYIGDHLGNAHLITDSNGNVLREESRYPYGLDWRVDGSDATTADYVYTGKEYDEETGLVYFGGRYYAPQMGRWTTPDMHFVEDPKAVLKRVLESNLYSYVRNNPIRWIDPNGEAAGDPYPTQHDAARSAILDINPTSIALNIEYAGFIYEKSKGVYSYTEPFQDGKNDEVDVGQPFSRMKHDIDITAYYHTHAADDIHYYGEIFSIGDGKTGKWGDISVAEEFSLDAYLGTPKERILYYDHDYDIVTILDGKPLEVSEKSDDYPLTILSEPSLSTSERSGESTR